MFDVLGALKSKVLREHSPLYVALGDFKITPTMLRSTVNTERYLFLLVS